jgi:hypothetical protein
MTHLRASCSDTERLTTHDARIVGAIRRYVKKTL